MEGRRRWYPRLRDRAWDAALARGFSCLSLHSSLACPLPAGLQPFFVHFFFLCATCVVQTPPQTGPLERQGAALLLPKMMGRSGKGRGGRGILPLLLVGERVMAAGECSPSLPAFRAHLARAVWHRPRLEAGLSWGEGWAPAAGRTWVWHRGEVLACSKTHPTSLGMVSVESGLWVRPAVHQRRLRSEAGERIPSASRAGRQRELDAASPRDGRGWARMGEDAAVPRPKSKFLYLLHFA